MSGSSVCQPEGSEFEFYLWSHFLPLRDPPHFRLTAHWRLPHGNGQYWGDLALLKRMAWAAESAKSALWCPAAASLSLSPSWPALLVNCGFPGLVCASFRGDARDRR